MTAADLAPFFLNCPRPTIEDTIAQIISELRAHRVEFPDDYPLAIEYGAKWRLYGMVDTPWGSRAESDRYRALYVDARHRAKLDEAHAAEGYTGATTVPRF